MIEQVVFHVASRANYFMQEIAQLYCDGFGAIGVPARIALDEKPDPSDAGRLEVIISPHEYFTFVLRSASGRAEQRRLAKRCWLLNTEQPGSNWFDLVLQYAGRVQGVFDINRQAQRAFESLGFPAIHVPLGYGPSYEDVHRTSAAKTVDVVFLGHSSPRRKLFFAEHAELFQRYDCRLIFAPVSRPLTSDSARYAFGPARNALLRSARILINVHSSTRTYFEWHRVLAAVANRCAVITETSEDFSPLVSERHFVMDRYDRLAERCVELLEDNSAWQAMVESAYELIRQKMPVERSCEIILEACEARRPPARPTISARWRTAKCGAYAFAYRLKRRPTLQRLSWVANRARLRLARPAAFSTIERTRVRMLRERADVQGRGREQDTYEVVTNAAAVQLGAPAISVIVTLSDSVSHIQQCLTSVANSATDRLPGGIELLVVGDRSPDGPAKAARGFIEPFSFPSRLVLKRENTGLAESRNLGIELARGRHVFILDADNHVYPRCFEKLYNTMSSGTYAAAYGIIKRFDDTTGSALGLMSQYGWDAASLVDGPYIDAMALFDRELLQSLGGYATDLLDYGWGWEDYELWLRIAQSNRSCILCPEILGAYRAHGPSTLTSTCFYVPALAKHFHQRFNDLLDRVDPGPFAFGAPTPNSKSRS
ncbi:MAG TPA: glycosyltransferase family A protein [Pirellulales bacterium]|nr:glycosyltransferase family A protein [Pirellulales bacterium]